MDWISLGGRGPPPSPPQNPPHPAIYEGLRLSNSPWIGFLPTTGSVVMRSSQGRFSFSDVAPKMADCIISGPDFLENVDIWLYFVIFHQFGIIGLDLDQSYFPSDKTIFHTHTRSWSFFFETWKTDTDRVWVWKLAF